MQRSSTADRLHTSRPLLVVLNSRFGNLIWSIGRLEKEFSMWYIVQLYWLFECKLYIPYVLDTIARQQFVQPNTITSRANSVRGGLRSVDRLSNGRRRILHALIVQCNSYGVLKPRAWWAEVIRFHRGTEDVMNGLIQTDASLYIHWQRSEVPQGTRTIVFRIKGRHGLSRVKSTVGYILDMACEVQLTKDNESSK